MKSPPNSFDKFLQTGGTDVCCRAFADLWRLSRRTDVVGSSRTTERGGRLAKVRPINARIAMSHTKSRTTVWFTDADLAAALALSRREAEDEVRRTAGDNTSNSIAPGASVTMEFARRRGRSIARTAVVAQNPARTPRTVSRAERWSEIPVWGERAVSRVTCPHSVPSVTRILPRPL